MSRDRIRITMDAPDGTDAISELLESLGAYEVTSTSDGDEAEE